MGEPKSSDKSGKRTRVVSKVKDGWISRDAASGRFVAVGSEKGTYRAKPNSEAAIEKASRERHDALKRLANR